jgi:hypothetical protein
MVGSMEQAIDSEVAWQIKKTGEGVDKRSLASNFRSGSSRG